MKKLCLAEIRSIANKLNFKIDFNKIDLVIIFKLSRFLSISTKYSDAIHLIEMLEELKTIGLLRMLPILTHHRF